MVLPIAKYGHPVLRQRGESIGSDREGLQQLINDMLETMYQAHGIGLAAQQIGQPIQLTVVDVTEAKDRPLGLWIDGSPAPLNKHMPMVLLNPRIEPLDAPVLGQEGCLSFPEIYGDVSRPETVNVEALQSDGSILKFRCNGLLARAVQHETDHLNGILFIDRMDRAAKDEIRHAFEALHAQTKNELSQGEPTAPGQGSSRNQSGFWSVG
ncbi:MAG: Peptide deformylase [Verrucomicrobia subdivision 3 bacterium]|nr:Peptide deformylase [Limisphaerales bacterium]MCS1417732.1 Peptide deformylase [Limisphaerales bacterium]